MHLGDDEVTSAWDVAGVAGLDLGGALLVVSLEEAGGGCVDGGGRGVLG